MHPQARNAIIGFLKQVDTTAKRVLEVGSYDVNGTVRDLFANAEAYHGIDIRPGPGVDEVFDLAIKPHPDQFNLIVSTETLEHAPNPQALIANAYATLASGGILMLTAAGPNRRPHSCDGRPQVPADEHYANIDPHALHSWLEDAGFTAIEIQQNERVHDVYAMAVKPEAPAEETPKPAKAKKSQAGQGRG